MQNLALGIVQARSISIGALRLQENPLSTGELDSLLAESLEGFVSKTDQNSISIVGVGGTCTTVAAVSLELNSYDPEKIQGTRIKLVTVEDIYQRLSEMSIAERLKVPGIYPGREDIIISGLQILKAVLQYFKATVFTVSDHDLLYGLIYEQRSI